MKANRILLFEDHPRDRNDIQASLRQVGFVVLTALNLPDSLSLIETHATYNLPCDALLIDANLHGNTDRTGRCGRIIHGASKPLVDRGVKLLNISNDPAERLGLQFDADVGKSPAKILQALRDLELLPIHNRMNS